MIHCNNGTWDFLIGIQDSFSEEFLKGGPFGFSCNIAEFSEEYKNRWSSVIENYKKTRNFFKNASARVLVDNDGITVIEYSDSKFEHCYIQIFTRTVYSNELIIYPKVDASEVYLCGEDKIPGDEILSDGIFINSLQDNSCV